MPDTRVYLDTSVISALDDVRNPERAELTRVFWDRRHSAELITCEVARTEIEATHDSDRREQMIRRLAEVTVHALTQEMINLSQRYMDAGVFPVSVPEDALHVAAAVLLNCDVLLSWNFKHMVNRQRRLAISAVNVAAGVPTIEIIAPPEF